VGAIAFAFTIGPTNLPPPTAMNNTTPTPTSTPTPSPSSTPLPLPDKLVWKIALPFDQNSNEVMPIRDWVDDIKAASNGRWQIEIYYNEQLATKDKTLDGIKNGLFQGGLISSRFGGDYTTPLLTVLQIPFMSVSDITQQGEWLMAVAQYPAIVGELSTWNAQILFPICSPPYNFMGNIPLRTADDFVGRKINCYNRGAQALKSFGAITYNIDQHLLHSALQNGTVDSVSLPWSVSFVGNGFEKVAKYATVGIDLIIEDMYLAICKDAWNELPDEWKKLCQNASTKAIAFYAKIYADKDAGFIPVCRSAGIEIINFPEVERAKLVAKAASVWELWVQEMEAKGLPGREVLNFAKTKMDEIKSGITQ
jgi:TRAP-type C4-dicarboxylate transport system substrate-binding protein